MQVRWRDIWQSIEAPLLGFSVVVLALFCLLLSLCVIVVVTRAVTG